MTVQAPMRILFVEDSPSDALILRETLRGVLHTDSVLQNEETLDAAVDRICREHWDVVLLDLGLPDSNGLETLTNILPCARRSAVVVMTGLADEALGLKAISLGAEDYIVKGQMDGPALKRALRYALERKRAEQRLRDLVSSVPGVVWETRGRPGEAEHHLVFVSDYVETLLGYTAVEIRSSDQPILDHVHPDDQAALLRDSLAAYEREGTVSSRFRLLTKDRRTLWAEMRASPVLGREGRPIGVRGVILDVSDTVRAAEALQARYASEREARRQTELARRRLQLLAGASAKLGASLDVGATIGEAARVVVPALADGCAVYLLRDGALQAVEVLHLDPDLVRRITDERLDGQQPDEHIQLVRDPAIGSVVRVPLRAHGHALGELVLVSRDPDAPVSNEDLTLAEELGRRIAGAVENARLYEERARETERLAVTLRSIGDGVIATDNAGRVQLVNDVAERLTGWTQAEAHGKPLAEVFRPEGRRLRSRDGGERTVSDAASPIRDGAGRVIGSVVVFRDVTEQERMEAEMQRSNTLDALGLLAGGIAHDFNNLLTAILGNLSIARARPDPARQLERITAAEAAAIRARDLTQQLLTFAKGGTPIRKPASLPDIVRDSAEFAVSGSAVRAVYRVDPDLWAVDVDTGQISQVVQNLVINAQQAMPDGGSLDLVLRNVVVGDSDSLPLRPGRYVRLDVADTGTGIPAEHLRKIFDPFFTTKQGGSGLGLATTYAIVKKHDGHVAVESEPGDGTTFSVYLPATSAPVEAHPRETSPARGSGERILVMDDEEAIRSTSARLLEALGYEPTTVACGEEAIAAFRDALGRGEPFACVILDVTVTGGMGGIEAARHLLALDPAARLLVSSGYSASAVMADHAAHGFTGAIAKPYGANELAAALGETLAPRGPRGSDATRGIQTR
jgi:PAS domain S-box-containing protein